MSVQGLVRFKVRNPRVRRFWLNMQYVAYLDPNFGTRVQSVASALRA